MIFDARVHRRVRFGFLTVGLIALAAQAADWPTYQGNAAHTGHVAGTYGFTNVKLLWKTTAYAGALSGIAIGDKTVVVTNQARFLPDASVHALDQSTGTVLWSQAFGSNNDTTSPPAYAQSTFYVQSDGNTYVGGNYLHAFDAATGYTIFSSPYNAQWETYLNPTPYGSNIYMGGGYYGGMYSFNATTGAQNWFGTVPQYDGWTPTIDGTYAYAYTGSGDIVPIQGVFTMIKIADGTTAASIVDPIYNWTGYTMNSAVVLGNGNTAFTVNGGRLVSWNTQLDSTHKPMIRWSATSGYTGQPSFANSTPTSHIGRVFVSNNGQLNVINGPTGQLLWTWTPPTGSIQGPMVVTDDLVFASTGTTTYAISRGHHTTVWSYNVSGILAFSNSTLYVAGSDGNVYAFKNF